MKNIFKKLIYLLAATTLLLFGFSSVCFSQTYPSAPETLQEVKEISEQIIQKTPNSFKETSGEAISIWKKLWGKSQYWIRIVWDKTYSFLNTEVEKRKPEVKQELEKEVEELKEEIKKEAPSVWQRFRQLIGR